MGKGSAPLQGVKKLLIVLTKDNIIAISIFSDFENEILHKLY